MNPVVMGAPVEALMSALCLRHFDLQPRTLLGPAPTAPRLVALTPNATRILHALRLRQPLADSGIEPEHLYFRHWQSGFIFGHRPLGAVATARHGAPWLLYDESVLADLLERLAQPRIQTIESSAAVACSIEATSDAGSRLHINGAPAPLTILCGHADALPRLDTGALPDVLFGPGATGTTPGTRWLAQPCADPGTTTPVIDCWLGPGVTVTIWPTVRDVDGQHWRHVSLSAPDRADPRDRVSEAPAPHPLLAERLVDTGGSTRIDVADTRMPGRWSVPGAVRLGTQLAVSAPELATDPGMAAEDAWVLACLLEAFEDDVPRALADYRDARHARRERVISAAIAWQAWLARPAGAAAWRRNLRLAFESRLLPELALQQFDWLYGYNLPGRFY